MRAAVSSTPVAGVRPTQRVPRHLRRLVQVPCVLRVQVLRRAAGVPRTLAAHPAPAVHGTGAPADLRRRRAGLVHHAL